MPLIVAIREWQEGKTSRIQISGGKDGVNEYFKDRRELGRRILRDNFSSDVEYYLRALSFALENDELGDLTMDGFRATVEIILGTLDDAALGSPYYKVEE